MGSEYEYRYGKIHKSVIVGVSLLDQADLIPEGPLTYFANCSLYKDDSDVTSAYKKTMVDKWTNDKKPPTKTSKRAEIFNLENLLL